MSALAENLETIRARIAAACARAGRDPASVRLLGASKGVEAERIREAMTAGLNLFGENRVQEAAVKIEEVGGGAYWHLIGHLQKNKTRAAVECFDLIQSVDSLALAQIVDREAARAGKRMPILLEVNVAGEKTKFGFPPDELLARIQEINALRCLEIHGLMAIPPFCEQAEKARPYFRALRALQERLGRETDIPLAELSMGMSHDFEIAIEEGATLVRVGTALFGPRRRAARAEENLFE